MPKIVGYYQSISVKRKRKKKVKMNRKLIVMKRKSFERKRTERM